MKKITMLALHINGQLVHEIYRNKDNPIKTIELIDRDNRKSLFYKKY